MCAVVRYYDFDEEKIKESLWDLIDIYDKEDSLANAEQLTDKIMRSFENYNIPIKKNIFGYLADTCSLNMGENSSISTKLKDEIPHLTIVKCPCHMEQLCAKSSMDQLPAYCRTFMTDVNNYILMSSKKSSGWKFLQIKANIPPLRGVKPGFTRWLSLKETVTYILSRWHALKEFFRRECDAKEKRAEAIYTQFHNKTLRLYLIFL